MNRPASKRQQSTETGKVAHLGSWSADLAVMAALALFGVLLYAHTLHVPWYMDDFPSIVDNPSIRDLKTSFVELLATTRGFVNFTFALNYAVGGDSVPGYHAVNIALHLLTSGVVYLLLKRVFPRQFIYAAGGAMIFLAHPLQTQAVTYIVQRATGLAALMFFLSMYCYTRARETSAKGATRPGGWYAGALLCGVLAVLVKQNTAVLPLALLLYDRYFLSAENRLPRPRQTAYVAPFVLIPILLALKMLLLPMLSGENVVNIGKMPNLVHLEHLSPLNYLVTEFSVIWYYLKLLFFPFGQALDYDFPIVATLFNWQSLSALLGIIILLVIALLARRRFPHLSFGIFWFFLALAVESTIIPLDPIFEHRLYLPMFGFSLVVMSFLARLPARLALSLGCVLILILAVLTWQRNDLWNAPLAFYQDNLLRAPRSERVYLEVGNALMNIGQTADAQRAYKNGLAINPDYTLLALALAKAYALSNDNQAAVDLLRNAIEKDPENDALYANLGGTYLIMKQYTRAIDTLQKGLAVSQDNANIYHNLGVAYEQTGRLEEALANFQHAIELDEKDPRNYYSLGVALSRHGQFQKALQAYLKVLQLDPGNDKAIFYAALASHETGDVKLSLSLAEKLQQVNPVLAGELERRISGRN